MSLTTIGFGVGIALVVFLAFVVYRQLSSLDAREQRVIHTHEVVERSQALDIDIDDASRARRKYARTRDPADYASYREIYDRVLAGGRALRALTTDNPTQQRVLDQIDQVLAARLAQLDQAIQDGRERPLSAEAELALRDAGAVLSKRLDELIARFDATEQELLAERTASMQSGTQAVKRAIVGGLMASVAILALAFIRSRREIQHRLREMATRRAIEATVERANAYLTSAVDAIEDAFAIYDEEDRIVLANHAFRQLVALDGDSPIAGRTFEEVLEHGLAANTYKLGSLSREDYCARRLAAHRHPSGAFEVRTTDGRILRGTEMRTRQGGTVSLYVDITADVAREDELRLARAEAVASNAAKSEFLSSMSHELRTPLNAILGFTELLQHDRKEPLGRRHLDRLDRIATSGQHLLRLVEDVLDLAKMEVGRIQVTHEPVEVSEVVRDLQSTLAPMAAARGMTLTVAPVPAGEITTVIADRTRISQVLMNFGSNAIKYGRDGGRITLEIERSDGRVRIAVCDDGIGIPADKQARIFEPFHRAGQESGSIQGTGIGLTISKRLVEMMGGTIGFTSDSGRGSKFWIELPAAHRASDSNIAVAPAETASPLASEGPRALVVYVEDNPSNVALMEALVDDLPRVELVTASTAEEGIELIRARGPKAVIMDINLPGMSGLEATRKLAEWPETRNIPVIGLSAAALPADTERARATGFYRYLTKPVKVDELTSVLEQILAPPNA